MTINRKNRQSRETIPVLYISTEGKTEKNYFSLLNSRNAGFEIRSVNSKKTNALGVVEKCAELLKQADDPKDRGVAVFDVDHNPKDELINAAKLANESGI